MTVRVARRCLPGLGESLSRDGEIAWLRRTIRLGRGDDRGWPRRGIGGRCGDGSAADSVMPGGSQLELSVDVAEYKQVTVPSIRTGHLFVEECGRLRSTAPRSGEISVARY
jgi:hypothetical protein